MSLVILKFQVSFGTDNNDGRNFLHAYTWESVHIARAKNSTAIHMCAVN